MNFELNFGGSGANSVKSAEERSALVVLGDFCGSNIADKLPIKSRVVSIDSIDDAMRDWQPHCAVSLPSILRADADGVHRQTLTLNGIDDLHPDQLIQSIDWLRSLYSIWRNLDVPEQQAAALDALSQWQPGSPPAAESPTAEHSTTSETDSTADDLGRLLGKSVAAEPAASSAQRSASARLQSLVQQAVAGATTDAPDATVSAAKQQCAELLEVSLRAVLRDPGLQSVSRAWESVDWLLRRLDDELTTVTLVNLPERALYSQLAGAGSNGLAGSPLEPLLERATETSERCVMLGLYSFGDDIAELTAAAQLAALAGRQGGIFAGHGELSLAGCTSPALLEHPEQWPDAATDALTFWAELQNHAVAKHLFLAAPQFILRQPFGATSDPLESFPFEELSQPPATEEFSWGNPALAGAIALLTGDRAFSDIPQPVFNDGTGQALQLPIEGRVSDGALSALKAAGLQALRYNPSTGQVVL